MRAQAVHLGLKFSLQKGALDIFTAFRKKNVCTEDSKLKNKFHAWYERKVSHLFFISLVMTVIK
jgi:hypothetical protein